MARPQKINRDNELNKKLAEWAGLQVRMIDTPTGKPEMWKVVSISEYTNLGWLDFTQSLDACFKWLVPKLSRISLERTYYLSGMTYIAKAWAKDGIHRTGYNKETPALAICLAISKLIEKDIDKTSQ